MKIEGKESILSLKQKKIIKTSYSHYLKPQPMRNIYSGEKKDNNIRHVPYQISVCGRMN